MRYRRSRYKSMTIEELQEALQCVEKVITDIQTLIEQVSGNKIYSANRFVNVVANQFNEQINLLVKRLNSIIDNYEEEKCRLEEEISRRSEEGTEQSVPGQEMENSEEEENS